MKADGAVFQLQKMCNIFAYRPKGVLSTLTLLYFLWKCACIVLL